MSQIVPAGLLFDYRICVPACSGPSRKKRGRLLSLDERGRLPFLALDDSVPNFSQVTLGWNRDGLAVLLAVRGRSAPVEPCPPDADACDGIELWIDTRPTGTVHRATAYCHRVLCVARDENQDGEPSARSVPIAQQREIRQEMQTQRFLMRTHAVENGYDLEVWIPGSQLYGFREIDELRRLGFFCMVHDTELGRQPLTVTDDFPFSWNPSLWVHLELTDE